MHDAARHRRPRMTPDQLPARLAALRERIKTASLRANRGTQSVKLIAISKTRSPADIAALAAHGQLAFGENYLQEALNKIPVAECLAKRHLEWHFTGPIQSNKTAGIAAHFSWVHSMDRLRIARRLSMQRPDNLPPLSVCLQVNIANELTKSGCLVADAQALCAEIAKMPKLRLRGLMCVPGRDDSRLSFGTLRLLFDRIRKSGNIDEKDFDTLSMGMSDDFELAIEEGATAVRIGAALFGPRNTRNANVAG